MIEVQLELNPQPQGVNDLSGQKFGKLTVIGFAKQNKWRKSFWRCRCDCGKMTIVSGSDLKTGNTASCGCYWREQVRKARTTHGDSVHGSVSPEYSIWQGIKERCANPNSPAFENYGGRGISMCERWLNSYENFIADMGRRPTPKHTIERKDNERGYSQENCCWATRFEQARNTRRNHRLEIDGVTQTIADWASTAGIPASRLYARIKSGWDPKTAVTTPVHGRRK